MISHSEEYAISTESKRKLREQSEPLESIGSVRVAEGTGRPADSGSIMKSSLREAGTERRFEHRALESLVPLRGKERITNSGRVSQRTPKRGAHAPMPARIFSRPVFFVFVGVGTLRGRREGGKRNRLSHDPTSFSPLSRFPNDLYVRRPARSLRPPLHSEFQCSASAPGAARRCPVQTNPFVYSRLGTTAIVVSFRVPRRGLFVLVLELAFGDAFDPVSLATELNLRRTEAVVIAGRELRLAKISQRFKRDASL